MPLGHRDVDPRVELVAAVDVRGPKPETTGPSTGQISPLPLPAWIGPGRQRRRAGPRQLGGDLALDRGDRAVELLLVLADLAPAPPRGGRGRRPAPAGGSAPRRGRSPAPALRRRSCRGRLRSGPWSRAGDRRCRCTSSRSCAHAADDRVVHAVDAVEVFGAVDEVFVAAGADDHAEQVGGAGLIDRHQALAQRHQGPFQVGARRRQPLLGDVEPGDRAGRARPAWRRGGRAPPASRRRSAATSLVSRSIWSLVAGDRRRQHALAFAAPRRARLLGFELRLEICGGRGGAGEEQHGERRRGGEQTPPGRGESSSIDARLAKARIGHWRAKSPCNGLAISPRRGAFSTRSRPPSASSSICSVVCSIPKRSCSSQLEAAADQVAVAIAGDDDVGGDRAEAGGDRPDVEVVDRAHPLAPQIARAHRRRRRGRPAPPPSARRRAP